VKDSSESGRGEVERAFEFLRAKVLVRPKHWGTKGLGGTRWYAPSALQ
jgi:hypothetical protein